MSKNTKPLPSKPEIKPKKYLSNLLKNKLNGQQLVVGRNGRKIAKPNSEIMPFDLTGRWVQSRVYGPHDGQIIMINQAGKWIEVLVNGFGDQFFLIPESYSGEAIDNAGITQFSLKCDTGKSLLLEVNQSDLQNGKKQIRINGNEFYLFNSVATFPIDSYLKQDEFSLPMNLEWAPISPLLTRLIHLHLDKIASALEVFFNDENVNLLAKDPWNVHRMTNLEFSKFEEEYIAVAHSLNSTIKWLYKNIRKINKEDDIEEYVTAPDELVANKKVAYKTSAEVSIEQYELYLKEYLMMLLTTTHINIQKYRSSVLKSIKFIPDDLRSNSKYATYLELINKFLEHMNNYYEQTKDKKSIYKTYPIYSQVANDIVELHKLGFGSNKRQYKYDIKLKLEGYSKDTILKDWGIWKVTLSVQQILPNMQKPVQLFGYMINVGISAGIGNQIMFESEGTTYSDNSWDVGDLEGRISLFDVSAWYANGVGLSIGASYLQIDGNGFNTKPIELKTLLGETFVLGKGEGISCGVYVGHIFSPNNKQDVNKLNNKEVNLDYSKKNKIIFQFGNALLTDQARFELRRFCAVNLAILTNPNSSIVLVGHADRPDTFERNLELSKMRAENVKQAMLDILGTKLSENKIETMGAGKTMALKFTQENQHSQKSRRVDIYINGLFTYSI